MPSPTFSTEVLLRSEQTGDRVAVVVTTVPAGWAGPPLHHHDFDEAFHVLDGELTFQVEDRLYAGGAGAVAFAPRGVPHTLANLGATPARYVLVITPGGFERYFDRIAAEQSRVPAPKSADRPFPETVVAGPPIAANGEPVTQLPVARSSPSVLLRGEETGGEVSIVVSSMAAGANGPPEHLHDFDETFYVLGGGELTFKVAGELVAVRSGEVAFAEGGVAHTFANLGGEPSRYLIVCTPAGFERHFARIAARRAGVDPPQWALQAIPAVTIVGPRLGEEA